MIVWFMDNLTPSGIWVNGKGDPLMAAANLTGNAVKGIGAKTLLNYDTVSIKKGKYKNAYPRPNFNDTWWGKKLTGGRKNLKNKSKRKKNKTKTRQKTKQKTKQKTRQKTKNKTKKTKKY
jgi:hypothetical protein